MAALRGRRLNCLLLNFVNTVVNTNPRSNFHKSHQAFFHFSSLYFGPEGIKMPSLSPTMSEGKIVKWLKREGDVINPGDVLCDIETDKAVVSMEVEEEGVLAKILILENSQTVKVGSLIAVMVSPGEDWKNVEIPVEEGVPNAESSLSQISINDSEANNNQEVIIAGPSARAIKMPSLSPTMTSGTIIKWLKKEGDILTPGDELCEIQTDKAVMSMEVEEEGILAKIIVPDDTKDVKVNTTIAVIVPEGEDWKSVVVSSKPVKEKKETSNGASGTSEIRGKSFGPAVKALLSAYKIEPGVIKSTGRGNRLLKEDVLKYIEENNLEKKPQKIVYEFSEPLKSIKKSESSGKPKHVSTADSKYKDIELNNMRLTIAKRLLQSKQQIPHFYFVIKCDIDVLIKVKEALATEGIKVSLNDLLTKILGLTLQMYPKANALCINNEVKLSESVDICVDTAIDGGLYTTVIKAANEKSLISISEEIKELLEKARTGKLKPEEFQGGTFTISNLGMFGISHFKAIINPPQCGILAVGGVIESLNQNLEIKKHIIVNLSYDRRVLQEQEAAEFMELFKYFIENPKVITLGINQSIKMKL